MNKLAASCLSLLTPPKHVDELSFRLSELGASAIAEQDDTTMDKAPAGAVLLLAGFDSRDARDRAGRDIEILACEGVELRSIEVEDNGWSTAWRAHFKPVVLDRIQVITPWMEPPRSDRETIVIDPGQAFGTGGHATTRLVLRLLEELSAKGGLCQRVLDVGIGSGVLAIAAVHLGAEQVVGVDVELESIEATRENAARNNVSGAIKGLHGSVDVVSDQFQLVLANIQLAVFERVAAELSSKVAPGGKMLVSGLLEDQREACLALFPDFTPLKTLAEDGWIAVELER